MRLDIEKAAGLFAEDKFQSIQRMFRRGGLDERRRILVCLSALEAAGNYLDLTGMLKSTIEIQTDMIESYEVLLQGYLFCGYPKAIESFFCLGESLKGRDDLDPGAISPRFLEDSESLLRRGYLTGIKVHGDKFGLINNKISAFCPDLGYLMVAEGYGHVISRENLDLRSRELAVVSSLTVMGTYRQLHSHIRGSRNVGCLDNEIYEAIFTCLLWVYQDNVRKALDLLARIVGRDPYDEPFSEYLV